MSAVVITVRRSPVDENSFQVVTGDGFAETTSVFRNYFAAMDSALALQKVYSPAELRDLVSGGGTDAAKAS